MSIGCTVSLSLQEQLRRAGLVKEKQVKNVQKRQHSDDVKRRKSAERVPDPMKALAERELAEKAAKDRELNLQRQAKLEARARAAEIKQLVDTHRVARDGGEIAYNFVLGKKIKKMYVRPEQRDALVSGSLRIVLTGDQFDLVPAAIAERIAERDPKRIAPLRNSGTGNAADDEHYAKFQVPDDLDW